MVYYFISNVVSPSGFLYVGKDKVESEQLRQFLKHLSNPPRPPDEELIAHGLEADIW